jgi:cell division septal protein FtsQ
MKRALQRPAPEGGRFLRREGNLKVRRERRQRVVARTLTRIAVVAGTIGLASLGLGAGLRWLATTPALAVDRIEISGNEWAGEAALRSLAAGALSRNILLLDLDRVAGNVATHPWVRDVLVRKRLPRTLEVRVVERVPCAVMVVREEPYLVDTMGMPVDRFGPRYGGWSFPAFVGLDALAPAERTRRCRRAAEQLLALRGAAPHLHATLAEVDLSSDSVTVLRFPDRDEALRVEPGDWLRNLDAYRALQASLRGLHPSTRYVDLRWDGRLTVLPDPGTQP